MSEQVGRRASTLLTVAMVLTGGALAAVFLGPQRLGLDEWPWPRVSEPVWDRMAYPLVVFALLGGVVTVLWARMPRLSRIEAAVLVMLLSGLAFVAQVMVGQQGRAGYHESLFAVGLPAASSYHQEARKVTRLGEYLAGYEREVRRRPFRVQLSTHPAGPVVLFWCLNHAFAGRPMAAALFAAMSEPELAGVWLATLVLRLAASLVVVPVYLMASSWYGRRAGLGAAAFSAAIPSLLLFSPILDQCFPALAATACWLGYRAGERRSAGWAVLAGLAVSAGLFLSLAFAVVALVAALLAIVGLGKGGRRPQGRDLAKLLAGASAGLVAPVVTLYVAVGYNSLAVWKACWDGNAEFNRLTHRTYWKWALVNPVEFLAFLGVPLACLFVRRVASEVGQLGRRKLAGRDWPTLVVAGLLVLLDVLGANLGEVARLWMFLMPACAVAAAAEVERYTPYRRAVFLALFALQCLQVALFRAGLDVLNIT